MEHGIMDGTVNYLFWEIWKQQEEGTIVTSELLDV